MKQILKFPFAFFKIHFHRCFWLTRPTSSHFQECLYSVSGQVWNKPWSVCMSPMTDGCSHRDLRKRPSESAAWARRPARLSGVDRAGSPALGPAPPGPRVTPVTERSRIAFNPVSIPNSLLHFFLR